MRLNPVQVKQGNGNLAGIKAVSAGAVHACALKNDGTVWCWGWNQYGQLGDGTTGDANNMRRKAVQVKQGAGNLTDVKAISASGGGTHTCALKTNSTVWCWGDDAAGQLGDGTTGGSDNLRRTAVQVVKGRGN